MRRRNKILAATVSALLLLATAMAARAEPSTTLRDGPSDINAPTVPVDSRTTSPDGSTIPTTTPDGSTVDWRATDEFGSTLYATTTAKPTTTTKRTSRTEPPFVVNPAHPEDTDTRSPGYRPIPNSILYEAVTDENGNEVTRSHAETTTTETTTEEASLLSEESVSAFPEQQEQQQASIPWMVVAGVGALLLLALIGLIILMAKGRGSGDDDYIYEDEQSQADGGEDGYAYEDELPPADDPEE